LGLAALEAAGLALQADLPELSPRFGFLPPWGLSQRGPSRTHTKTRSSRLPTTSFPPFFLGCVSSLTALSFLPVF